MEHLASAMKDCHDYSDDSDSDSGPIVLLAPQKNNKPIDKPPRDIIKD